MSSVANPLSLAQWRRTVAEMYAAVRMAGDANAAVAAAAFRTRRDSLFAQHPDSPIPEERRAGWRGAIWYPYDPAWRVEGRVEQVRDGASFEIALSADGLLRCRHVATVNFRAAGADARLALYWLCGYGGGLWLPFADATSGGSTYGGGRYLYDTIKGADLGAGPESLLLDFNYAYNPSCAYEDRWSCPLPPPENRLPFAVTAGERSPSTGS